ncbi:hypothetical protein TIFTF001_040143 [Ficus carica]|uniref:Uncharacterized protein n=1 Tax=Ficus carica TaxID=3494 RepID=A0AA88CMB4_FICCA|nr:hypothetical protein TIFTF001_040143 [Ficus carica]
MILILLLIWKQEENLSLCLIRTTNLEPRATCKYNSAYSIGSLMINRMNETVFKNKIVFKYDVKQVFSCRTDLPRGQVSRLLAILDARRWGMAWLTVKLRVGYRYAF